MKVLDKNCYKFKPIKITAMKVLKTLLLHAMFSWIKKQPEKAGKGKSVTCMNKTLSKAIMQRSKLRNLSLKNRTEENRNNYVTQMNLCVTHLGKSKI